MHIFGLCPNHECPERISRLTDIEISFETSYKPDWLNKLEDEQAGWDFKQEGLLARQKIIQKTSKARAEIKMLPGKLRGLAPAFSATGIAPRDIRVISNPVDFIGFDGMSMKHMKRIVLMDAKSHGDFRRKDAQESIEAAVERGKYDWQVLRIDEDGLVTQE
jgi:predicted Holliday junction resolvase-like endonuclease